MGKLGGMTDPYSQDGAKKVSENTANQISVFVDKMAILRKFYL